MIKFIQLDSKSDYVSLSPLIGDIRDLEGQVVLIKTQDSLVKIDGTRYISDYKVTEDEKEYIEEFYKIYNKPEDLDIVKDQNDIYHLFDWKNKVFLASFQEFDLIDRRDEVLKERLKRLEELS